MRAENQPEKKPYHRRVRQGVGFFTLEQCRELIAWALHEYVADVSQHSIALENKEICGRQKGLKMHTSNVMNLVRFWLVKNTDTSIVTIAEASAVHHSTVTRNVQRFEEYVQDDASFRKILGEIDQIAVEFNRKHFVPKSNTAPVHVG